MMKHLIIISISLLLSFNLLSQNNTVQGLIKEGIELHDSTEYKKAVDKFKQALKINPHSILAQYEISLSYLELQEFGNAVKYSTQVINAHDPNLSVGAYAVKSQGLAGLGKLEEAINVLQEGLIKNGDTYLLHFNLALNYFKKNNIDKTLEHVERAIELDKSYSGAFLLNAYALMDKSRWVESIYSFQMFLLLEPDSKRSKGAFEEMLHAMQILDADTQPVERSFIQRQLMKDKPKISSKTTYADNNNGMIKEAIRKTLDSLHAENKTDELFDVFNAFKEVNKTILQTIESNDFNETKSDSFKNFYYPFFRSLLQSQYYEAFSRYISVSYFPASIEWWEANHEQAQKFINWFEKGDEKLN